MTTRLSKDRAAVVDSDYHWVEVGPDTPRGTKVQLINRALGVAVYGYYQPGSGWTHWAPLPTFARPEFPSMDPQRQRELAAPAQITKELVAQLRDKSDECLMVCKQALVLCGGDIERAEQLLRTRNLARLA